MERKSFEFKGAVDTNVIRGAAAIIGNLDDGRDVIFPGAFGGGVLGRFLKNGFVSIGHDWGDLPIAMPTKAREQGNALECEAVFHNTPRAQEARTVASERLAQGLTVGQSIGFELARKGGAMMFDTGSDLLDYARAQNYDLDMFDQKGITAHPAACRAVLKLADLYEYSLVPVPMNRLAVATEAKGATAFTDMPMMARDHPWDASAAEKRVRAWAGAEDAPNAKYRRAFLWHDEDAADSFGSYKLQFADVDDGQLKAVPRALFACAGAMQGARGGVDIPDDDKAAVKSVIERWYARMRKMFDDDTMRAPWMDEGEGMMSRTFDVALISTVRDAERALRDAGFSKAQSAEFISHVKAILLRRDAEGDGAADTTDTKGADGQRDVDQPGDAQGEPDAAPETVPPTPAPVDERPAVAHKRIVFSGAGGEVYDVRTTG